MNNLEIKKIGGTKDDYKVVNLDGRWLFAGELTQCKKFVELYKEPTEIINNEFSQKVGKILDNCFCGEITRDEAIKSIWGVKTNV